MSNVLQARQEGFTDGLTAAIAMVRLAVQLGAEREVPFTLYDIANAMQQTLDKCIEDYGDETKQ